MIYKEKKYILGDRNNVSRLSDQSLQSMWYLSDKVGHIYKLPVMLTTLRLKNQYRNMEMLSEKELLEIEMRVSGTQNGPWKAYIEGRDHESGSSFIMTGVGENRGEDIEMFGATEADYDFIANAKQDIPKLIKEIRELKKLTGK